jgi:hypothetical protein
MVLFCAQAWEPWAQIILTVNLYFQYQKPRRELSWDDSGSSPRYIASSYLVLVNKQHQNSGLEEDKGWGQRCGGVGCVLHSSRRCLSQNYHGNDTVWWRSGNIKQPRGIIDDLVAIWISGFEGFSPQQGAIGKIGRKIWTQSQGVLFMQTTHIMSETRNPWFKGSQTPWPQKPGTWRDRSWCTTLLQLSLIRPPF